MELHIRCQYGQKKHHGKVVRGKCDNRASGFFRVYPTRGKARVMALCADCGFVKMPNHVAIVMPGKDAPADAKPIYYRDISRVELIATLGTSYDQTKDAKHEGVKHWVESSDKPKRLAPGTAKLKRIKSTKPKMDMATYIQSLRRHDDGK